jgi:putative transposase
MPTGRPKPPLVLSPEESQQLRAIAASRTLPHGLVMRARIILLSASGMSNQAIVARLHLNQVTVGHWRRRFLQQGLAGLHGELRPGRPRSISDERVAALIRKTLRAGPHSGTHWSCRSLAAQTRLSKSTVHRIWHAFGLQPHRQRHFQLSNDPFFDSIGRNTKIARSSVHCCKNPLLVRFCHRRQNSPLRSSWQAISAVSLCS